MVNLKQLRELLPFFLPMPPMLFPFGTMGAFISIREPIPNRKALLEVGASGPIAGLLIAIPVTIFGFWLTEQNAVLAPVDSGDSLYLGTSLFFDFLYFPLFGVLALAEGSTRRNRGGAFD